MAGDEFQSVRSEEQLRFAGKRRPVDCTGQLRIGEDAPSRPKLLSLNGQILPAIVRRESDRLQSICMVRDHIQATGADGSCRSKYRNPIHAHPGRWKTTLLNPWKHCKSQYCQILGNPAVVNKGASAGCRRI